MSLASLQSEILSEIIEIQNYGGDLLLFALCGTFDLDQNQIHDKSFGQNLIERIYEKLGIAYNIKDDPDLMFSDDSSTKLMAKGVIGGVHGLITNIKDNFETVYQYKSVLQSKQRSLTRRDKYGDKDQQPWANYSSGFGIDKLKGVNPLRIYMEMDATIEDRQRVASAQLADMFGSFTRIMLGLILHVEKQANREADPIQTGRDYEEFLKSKIEERFPSAYVELTAVSGDHGGDLVVDLGGTRIVIQAKFYDGSVGNDAVKEVFTGKAYYEGDYAMVVCSSNYTRLAVALAEQLDVILSTTDDFLDHIEELADTGQQGS
jgi:restriction system protein